MTSNRLEKELRDIKEHPSSDWSVTPSTTDYCIWNGELTGPANSPYEGKSFRFTVQFDHQKYPFNPPIIEFQTPIFHPFHKYAVGEEIKALVDRLEKDAMDKEDNEERTRRAGSAPTDVIQFKVTRLAGKPFAVEMSASRTIQQFKEEMERTHGVSITQRYILHGKYLPRGPTAKSTTLRDLGITQSSEIQMLTYEGHTTDSDDCTCHRCTKLRWEPRFHTRKLLDEIVLSLQKPNEWGNINYWAGRLLALAPDTFAELARKHSG